jgi:NADPH:quinone reductase-like Zn-dependent oxidoreductase
LEAKKESAMRKVVQRGFGGPEVLHVVEAERPAPRSGEVLIRVHAVSLNPVDIVVRSGAFPLLGEPPFSVGWDVSGVVEAVGPGARFAPGDEVYGMPGFPYTEVGYSEYVTSPSRQVARKPATLEHAQAAALPLAGLTAWQGLVQAANVQPGQRVLVTRAAGGVGHLAVQIAKARGAQVTALAGASKLDFVRSLGADELVDRRDAESTAALADFDVVFDSSADGERSIGLLRPGGTLVSLTQHGDTALAEKVESAGRRFAGISVEPDYASLEALAELVDTGKLVPHVSALFPLTDVAKAHALLEDGDTIGKIVLTLQD